MRSTPYIFLLTFIGLISKAQSSSEIYHKIQKFSSFKSALYVAAHPDDENTRVISWLSNDQLARTGYLSLTRGDGGQNLIGKEMGADLGVLRTQELLAARGIDGGQQFFTRAVDFGYSKTASESLAKWGKEKILYDAIWVIRAFQPDVIITRFPPDQRGGHGHHTASAMIAIEAFEKAGDPDVYPDQLATLQTWQAKAVYWNASVWWNRNLDSIARNNEDYLVADIGGYNPYLGVSYNELGSMARSQHKCQGFGVQIDRGETIEYFQWLAGEKLNNSFFDDVNRTWKGIGSNEETEAMVSDLLSNFDFNKPEASLGLLFLIHRRIDNLPASTWKKNKLKQCKELIMLCGGMHFEALANDYVFSPNSEIDVTMNLLVRNETDVKLNSIEIINSKLDLKSISELPVNREVILEGKTQSPDYLWNPYWLNKPYQNTFNFDDKNLIGSPQNQPMILALVEVEHNGIAAKLPIPLEYKWRDRVKGEQIRPVVNMPKTSASFLENSFVFNKDETKTITLSLINHDGIGDAKVELRGPDKWKVEPSSQMVSFSKKHEEKSLQFVVKAPSKMSSGDLLIYVNEESGNSVSTIEYDHIPAQMKFKPADAHVLALDVDIDPGKVGYIEGAGDEVAQALVQLGYEVSYLSKTDISERDLSEFQTIVTGIRAFNTNPWLLDFHEKLMAYVENGGNLIVQYNTASRSFGSDMIGPYPFQISRDRVSEEDAEVSFVDPSHLLLNDPNKIEKSDFDGWVQERGLYFASDWDDNYQILFSWHDEDESPKLGGLIYAKHGKGSFIYTGISFFRQLPAGVPGAYKLLANLISHEAK